MVLLHKIEKLSYNIFYHDQVYQIQILFLFSDSSPDILKAKKLLSIDFYSLDENLNYIVI